MSDVTTAIKAMNLMFQMTPQLLALTGNAGIAQARDTGWSDMRNQIWDMTHRTSAGQRVFLPEDFINTPEDLFIRMAKFPLIMSSIAPKEALEIATGTNWLAAKLKFVCDDDLKIKRVLLEFRPLSLQQTPEENAAALLLSLGRIKLAMLTDEPLADDFECVRHNAEQASRYGTEATLKVNKWTGSDWQTVSLIGSELRELEIHHAALGLSTDGNMQISIEKYDQIRTFLEKTIQIKSPSIILKERLGETWIDGSDSERREHIKDALLSAGIMR
jgi:hypothetical protein